MKNFVVYMKKIYLYISIHTYFNGDNYPHLELVSHSQKNKEVFKYRIGITSKIKHETRFCDPNDFSKGILGKHYPSMGLGQPLHNPQF
jgi:hypothetical protein